MVTTIAPSAKPVNPPSTAPPTSGKPGTNVVVGYYTNWAQYRSANNGRFKFFPENIDLNLFTHIMYGFAKVTSTFDIDFVEWNDYYNYGDGGMYARMRKFINSKNPSVKMSISLGGWNFNENPATSAIFTTMAASQSTRGTFITNIIKFVRTYDFDGIDIDWEYPGVDYLGGRPVDKTNFVLLLSELRTAIEKEVVPAGKSKLLLTIAVGVGPSTIASAYDIANIHPSLDWIGLMTYDLHGSWDKTTGHHTQMYDPTNADPLNLSNCINIFLASAPANKLVMGVATYGRTFTVASGGGVGIPASGGGAAGLYTASPGFLAYYEIQDILAMSDTVYTYDTKRDVPFAYSPSKSMWIGYDDKISINSKVDWLLSKGMKGVMVWAMDLDNFIGGNPLTTILAQRLFVKSSSLQVQIKLRPSAGSQGGDAFNLASFRDDLGSQLQAIDPSLSSENVRVVSAITNSDGTIDVTLATVSTNDIEANSALSIVSGASLTTLDGYAVTSVEEINPSSSDGGNTDIPAPSPLSSLQVGLIAAGGILVLIVALLVIRRLRGPGAGSNKQLSTEMSRV